MKKLTAMLLSLMMCFSLMAIPAQAAFIPTPDGAGIIDVSGPKDPANPGDDDSNDPGTAAPMWDWPGDKEDIPVPD